MCTSPDVEPMMVSEAEGTSCAFFGSTMVSSALFGLKVCSFGAVPAGKVCALNSGIASLPTSLPGWCYSCVSFAMVRGIRILTPLDARGSAGACFALNSPEPGPAASAFTEDIVLRWI